MTLRLIITDYTLPYCRQVTSVIEKVSCLIIIFKYSNLYYSTWFLSVLFKDFALSFLQAGFNLSPLMAVIANKVCNFTTLHYHITPEAITLKEMTTYGIIGLEWLIQSLGLCLCLLIHLAVHKSFYSNINKGEKGA